MEFLWGLFLVGTEITVLFFIPSAVIYFVCEYFNWFCMGDFLEILITKIFMPILVATTAIGIFMLWMAAAGGLVNMAKEMI